MEIYKAPLDLKLFWFSKDQGPVFQERVTTYGLWRWEAPRRNQYASVQGKGSSMLNIFSTHFFPVASCLVWLLVYMCMYECIFFTCWIAYVWQIHMCNSRMYTFRLLRSLKTSLPRLPTMLFLFVSSQCFHLSNLQRHYIPWNLT